jgi:hypothetical protein
MNQYDVRIAASLISELERKLSAVDRGKIKKVKWGPGFKKKL